MAHESSTPDEKTRRTGAKDTADASRPAPDARSTATGGGLQGGGAQAGAQGGAAPSAESGSEPPDAPDAKLPHERDESPGDAGDAPRAEGQRAYEDARRGRPDTSKSEAMDQTYQRVRK